MIYGAYGESSSICISAETLRFTPRHTHFSSGIALISGEHSTLDGWTWEYRTIAASSRTSPLDTGAGCAVFSPYECAIPLTSRTSRKRSSCVYCATWQTPWDVSASLTWRFIGVHGEILIGTRNHFCAQPLRDNFSQRPGGSQDYRPEAVDEG